MNSLLTRKVIDLHKKGYELDFVLEQPDRLICVQNNRLFESECLLVILVQQGFDKRSGKFKYIHTVETPYGDKGLLLSDCVFLTFIYPHTLRDDNVNALTGLLINGAE
jgi:hypothetical protein